MLSTAFYRIPYLNPDEFDTNIVINRFMINRVIDRDNGMGGGSQICKKTK